MVKNTKIPFRIKKVSYWLINQALLQSTLLLAEIIKLTIKKIPIGWNIKLNSNQASYWLKLYDILANWLSIGRNINLTIGLNNMTYFQTGFLLA